MWKSHITRKISAPTIRNIQTSHGTHFNESWRTRTKELWLSCDGVMSHVVMAHVWRSHVTRKGPARWGALVIIYQIPYIIYNIVYSGIYERFMVHIRMHHWMHVILHVVTAYVMQSRHTESWHSCKWVMAFLWMSHGTLDMDSWHTLVSSTYDLVYMNGSCQRVMVHIQIRHGTRVISQIVMALMWRSHVIHSLDGTHKTSARMTRNIRMSHVTHCHGIHTNESWHTQHLSAYDPEGAVTNSWIEWLH